MDMAAVYQKRGRPAKPGPQKTQASSRKTTRRGVAFRCQKCPADRFDVISSEEIERRFERAAFDHCAALPGNVGEAGRYRIRTIEANARHAVAQRREHHP